MPRSGIDWDGIDKSTWTENSDEVLAEQLGVSKATVRYWRIRFGIPSPHELLVAEREQKLREGLWWCGLCKRYLPVEKFGRSGARGSGLRTECSECRKVARAAQREQVNAVRRQYYQENKAKVLARNAVQRAKSRVKTRMYMKQRLEELRRPFVEQAGGACQRCGYSEFTSGLAFHHVDPELKDEAPTKAVMSGNYERAYAELDKCVLLCMNCHQTYHSGRWAAEFVKREGLGWTLKK